MRRVLAAVDLALWAFGMAIYIVATPLLDALCMAHYLLFGDGGKPQEDTE